MLHGNIKKTLRLNRTIGLSFLFYGVLSYWASVSEQSLFPAWQVMTWSLLAVAFVLMNELGRATLKKFSETEASVPLEKISIFLPIILFSYTGFTYLISGQLWIMLFGVFPILQAQLFGHYQLSRGLLLTWLISVAILTPFGYPTLDLMDKLPLSALVIPFILALFHYGAFVSALVRSSSTQVSHLQSLATTDALTGLVNRRQFNHRLQTEIARARRHHSPLSLALFDIDDFKKVNDFYGHPIGDRILKELGQVIEENLRESDISARYGGEEFALILPETRQIEAYELLERLRSIVERNVFCLPDNPMTITISVGVAQMDLEHHTTFELVEQADAALYEAKHQGKNRVVYGVIPTPKININKPYASGPSVTLGNLNLPPEEPSGSLEEVKEEIENKNPSFDETPLHSVDAS